tara:strand:- start:65 stop:1411 length:1347 start_codon:yes stop_codon:yes gene_type:complete
MRIYFPYLKEFVFLILSYFFIYINIPFITIFYILIISFLIYFNNDLKKSILFFIILSYSLPYNFISFSGFVTVGNYINEYLVAGLPLYFILPRYFSFSLKKLNFLHKIILFTIITLFLISSFIPGFLNFLSLGGYSVRLIFVFNFLNAIILFYLISMLKVDLRFIKSLSYIIINLGVLLSILGIIQYLGKFSIVPNFEDEFFNYSRLFLFNNINSNSCTIFLLTSLSFLSTKFFLNDEYSFINIIKILILMLAIYLTFTRLAYIIIFIIFVCLFYIRFKSKINFLFFVVIITIPIVFIGYKLFMSYDSFQSVGSSYTRLYLWALGITSFLENPLIGYGLGNQVESMFINESIFNLDLFESNSVETFFKQTVHQYLIDGLLAFGIFFIVPYFLIFYRVFFFKEYIYTNNFMIFFVSLKLTILCFYLYGLINVIQQHFILFGFFGFYNKK